MATRTGKAEWRGGLRDGRGEVTVGYGAFTGSYSYASRFEEGQGTNPEELIAAAHAACYSMALANVLAEHGAPPASVQTTASVHLRPVDGAPTIARIDLDTVAEAPGLDEASFKQHAQEAKEGCPVSRALAAVPEITLEARLIGT
ncbi:MAG TPA: OsmC family protein [Solirubrobacteraceae bacterium]|jgi:osmotically inducible protein OsmC|nr:OsmC family protein [Solirubrobacteraceae bacterium]